MSKRRPTTPAKPPLRVPGILFALAANLLLTTLADMLVGSRQADLNLEIVATLVAPLLAGILTALYIRQRAALHAFIGGMISIPFLAIYVFNQNWQFAVFAGAFCALGGAMSEILLRRSRPPASP